MKASESRSKDTTLREITGGLSPDEGAGLQPVGHAQEDEVQGYVLPSGQKSPQNNNPTYGQFYNALTNYIGGIVGAPLRPV